jgi:hypothetical protein
MAINNLFNESFLKKWSQNIFQASYQFHMVAETFSSPLLITSCSLETLPSSVHQLETNGKIFPNTLQDYHVSSKNQNTAFPQPPGRPY